MAVELLLKNVSDVHPNPRIDRISSLKRGDLTFAKTLPDDWNTYETLPEFARLIVSDANISGVSQYMEPWYVELDYETLNYDDVNDIYTVRMFSNTPGLGEIGVLKPADVASHLENWGLAISGFNSNEVVFEADMKKVFESPPFWGGVAQGLVFSHISFDLPSKTHTFKLSYSGYLPYRTSRTSVRNEIENFLFSNNATIAQESIYGQLMEIVIPSLTVVQKFKTDIASKAKKIVFARRYYITNGAMNTIEAYMQNNNGDAMTTDKATLLTYLNDRLDEI